jgi:hypothetical protein
LLRNRNLNDALGLRIRRWPVVVQNAHAAQRHPVRTHDLAIN